MISLMIFTLKRKLCNRGSFIKYILVFLIIGMFIHLDVLINHVRKYSYVDVKLDQSVNEYFNYFKDSSVVHYVEEADIRIVYEDEWKLYTDELIDEKILNEIEKCIEHIPGNERLTNYSIEVHHSRVHDYALELVVYTIIYFLCMSKSVSIVQEIIEDKLSGMHRIYLCSLKCSQYVMSKILGGWMSIFVEYSIYFIYLLIWLLIRYGINISSGFIKLIGYFIVLDSAMFRLHIVLMGIGSLFIGCLCFQYLIILYMSKAKNIDEANTMTIGIHVVPIVIYYVAYGIYEVGLTKLGINIPILQTLLLPMSLSFEGNISYFLVFSLVLATIYVVFIVNITQNMLRRRLLNIEKSYESI